MIAEIKPANMLMAFLIILKLKITRCTDNQGDCSPGILTTEN
jgi:hypothetical protein